MMEPDLNFGLPSAVVRMKARRQLAEHLKWLTGELHRANARRGLGESVTFRADPIEPLRPKYTEEPLPPGQWSPLTGITL